MNVTVGFLAGSAAGLTFTVTTTVATNVFPSLTAEAKAADLRKLYDMIEARHRLVVDKILPKLPKAKALHPDFEGMEKRTILLEGYVNLATLGPDLRLTDISHISYGVQLDEIEGSISCGGMYRWSPMFLREDITQLFNDLSTLDLNTLVRRFPRPTDDELTIVKTTSKTANGMMKECKWAGICGLPLLTLRISNKRPRGDAHLVREGYREW